MTSERKTTALERKPRKPATTTRPVRVDLEVYALLQKHLQEYVKLNKLSPKATTFSHYLKELLGIAELLLNGKEYYSVGDKLYTSAAEAWGAAVLEHVSTGKPSTPSIFLRVGEDTRFEIGEKK